MQFKGMDFTATFDIMNRPAMDAQGNSQIGGVNAFYDQMNSQLGQQGFKDFRKFLKGYQIPDGSSGAIDEPLAINNYTMPDGTPMMAM